MQVCTSLQRDNHASTPPLIFYRPDSLPAAQPAASKHWREVTALHRILFNLNILLGQLLFGTHYWKLSLIVILISCLSLGWRHSSSPGLSLFLFSAHCLAPAPLKLQPYIYIYIYIVYFTINAARQNKNTNRHTDTQYTNIKLQPIQRIRTIYYTFIIIIITFLTSELGSVSITFPFEIWSSEARWNISKRNIRKIEK